MLLPRFSLRLVLLVMTGCSLVFLVFGQAVRGSAWAMGLSLAIASLALVFVIFAAQFLVFWKLSQLLDRGAPDTRATSGLAGADAHVVVGRAHHAHPDQPHGGD